MIIYDIRKSSRSIVNTGFYISTDCGFYYLSSIIGWNPDLIYYSKYSGSLGFPTVEEIIDLFESLVTYKFKNDILKDQVLTAVLRYKCRHQIGLQ